jgi:membrane-bound serine protease (ClpP class)
MKKITFALLLLILIFSFSLPSLFSADRLQPIHVIRIDDKIINPITEEFIVSSIAEAEEENAACIILELDTPGGLLQSTRTIVKEIMNSSVPVITYISPSGSRAGSAGVFITLASHLSAMAPSTNIGAAHPVDLNGNKKESISDLLYELVKNLKKLKESETPETDNGSPESSESSILSDKILNDTSAWIRAIAVQKKKNSEWAENAVRNSVSQTETEALTMNIIDCVATDINDLLKQAEGRVVTMSNGTQKILALKDTFFVTKTMTNRQKMLMAISHPNIAYILMMLGFYGLLFEVTHPGIGFPGIAGAICLILAFFSLSTLPINYAGILLIGLSLILFIAEAQVVSYGLLTLGGLISMFLGSLMLVESEFEFMRVSLMLILPVLIITASITLFCISAVTRVHKRKSLVGKEALEGSSGVADTDINPFGTVYIHGEIWQARSKTPIKKGEGITVIRVQNLELLVEKKI